MDVNELKTKHPDLAKQIADEAVKANQSAQDAAMKTAQTGLLTRIMGIVKAVIGEDGAAKVQKIIDAGLSADQLSAVMAIMGKPETPADDAAKAPDGDKAKILAAIEAGQKPLTAGAPAPPDEKVEDFEALVEAHMKENPKVTRGPAMMAVRKNHPSAYDKWIEKQQKK